MNEALKNIMTRRSTRKYKPDMVPDEIIQQIIDAGICAPTASNKQSPIIVAVTNKELRDRLSKMNGEIMGVTSDPFYGAPVVLIVLAEKERSMGEKDGSCVMQNLMLAAHALGIASCWINRAYEEFETEEGKAILRSIGIEKECIGVGHCILGYADESYVYPELKRKEDWVYWVR